LGLISKTELGLKKDSKIESDGRIEAVTAGNPGTGGGVGWRGIK